MLAIAPRTRAEWQPSDRYPDPAVRIIDPSFAKYRIALAKVEKIASGIKLWSYGLGDDSAWSTLSTAKHQTYIEIQGGPIGDQSIKLEMRPKQTRWHIEYWIPTISPIDIYTLKTPQPRLRPTNAIPLFDWARNKEVKVWKELINAYREKARLPEPPELDENLWAPSGMENMDAAFKWAIDQTNSTKADHWRYYYGAWLAGRGEKEKAIAMLFTTKTGLGKALLARLLKLDGKLKESKQAYDSIEEKWLQLHPQIIIERDKVLRGLGTQTIPERETWLARVDALKDEGIIERKIQLLIDKGNYKEAKDLLLSTPFQKVHQTYTRTGLWKQICEKLNIPFLPIPAVLGEDRLATFGAYREYE